MEADDDAPLEPLTDDDDDKETKGGKPPKLASAEDSSRKKGMKQRKTRGTVEDTTEATGKGKGKVVDTKASKVRKEGE